MPQIGSFTRDETGFAGRIQTFLGSHAVAYTHPRAHETGRNHVCRLPAEKKKKEASFGP